MIEKVPLTSEVSANEQPRTEREGGVEGELSRKAYEGQLEALSARIPEVEARREELGRAGAQLIESYGVTPDFFDDDNRSMLFASLAGNVARLEGLPTDERSVRKREFAAAAAFLLTVDHATGSEKLRAHHKAQMEADSVDDDHMLRVFDKYTDRPTTHEVVEKIRQEGYLREVADKLGVEGEPTEEVEIRVLNIGGGHESANFKHAENGVEFQEAYAWAQGLRERGEEFARDMIDRNGELAARAAGFASRIHDREMFMLPRGSAEVLLAEENGVELSVHASAERVIGTIKHEFTHNHGNVRVGEHFGYAVEERRAEHFGGDKSEYFEVKKMFNEIAILSGTHVKSLFDKVAETQKRGEHATIYEELSKVYGLDMTIAIAATMPNAYVPYVKSDIARSMLENGIAMEMIGAEYATSLTETELKGARGNLVDAVRTMIGRGVSQDFLLGYYASLADAVGVSVTDILQEAVQVG